MSTPHLDDTHASDLNMRYHYMDNLRALAMILGVFFHSAMAYMPIFQSTYVLADPRSSKVLEFFALLSHLFRMPVFMLVAGFFAHYLYRKYGLKEFIKNRCLRILLPLVIFLPVIIAMVIAVIVLAASTMENKPTMLLFLMQGFAPGGEGPQAQFSTFHLWFLFNLLLFYILAIIWLRFSPWSFTEWAKRASASRSHVALLAIAPLVIASSFYAQTLPPVQPADKLYPQWWSFTYFGVFFLIGWIYFTKQSLFDGLKAHVLAMLVLGLGLFAIVFTQYPQSLPLESLFNPEMMRAAPPKQAILALLQAWVSVLFCIALVLAARVFLSTENRFMRYISDASYWMYIIHVPIVMLLTLYLNGVALNAWLKFVIVSLGTLLLCIITYQIFVRFTPIGWMLNGRHKLKRESRRKLKASLVHEENLE